MTLADRVAALVPAIALFGGRVVPSVTDAQIRAERPIVPPSLHHLRVAYAAGARAFDDVRRH